MASNYKNPTPEQLDSVTIVVDEATHQQFYLVRSATDAIVTYQVRWNSHFSRWSCQCKGNSAGYICWHLRAALEVGRQHAELKRAEAEVEARIAENDAMMARVEHANQHPYQYSESEIKAAQKRYAPRLFSIIDDGAGQREADQRRNVTHQCADSSWW
jgi:hypothetical protein